MRVLAWPKSRNRFQNPFNWLLYQHMQSLGVQVDEFSPGRLLRDHYHVLNVHWPETTVNSRGLMASLARSAIFMELIKRRPKQTRLVWTVHNLSPHESYHPKIQTKVMAHFIRQLDGAIYLTESARHEALQIYAGLEPIPSWVIPHGHYRSAYPNDSDTLVARERLNIPHDARVILFFGQMRPYKNLAHLIRVFGQISSPNLRLILAGECKDSKLEKSLRQLAASDGRVRLEFKHIENPDVQYFFKAANLVALPYTAILNSGTALLALSFDRPILVPQLGAMPELADQIGKEWVHLYDGELSANVLNEAITQHAAPILSGPRLEYFDWASIAKSTKEAFDQLVP